MTQAKAAQIMGILVNANYIPSLEKVGPDNYRITVTDVNGVDANTQKNFQDNNNVTVAAKVMILT